jgi:hypothetical protein
MQQQASPKLRLLTQQHAASLQAAQAFLQAAPAPLGLPLALDRLVALHLPHLLYQ